MSLATLGRAVAFGLCAIACSVSAKNHAPDTELDLPDASRGQGGSVAGSTGGTSGGVSGASGGVSGASGAAASGGAPSGTGGIRFDDNLDAAQDPEVYCTTASKPGEPLVIPCMTEIWLDAGPPAQVDQPGGSHCFSTSYMLSLMTQVLHWTRCIVDPDPLRGWQADSGSRQLSDTDLAALLGKLKIVTVSSATPCAVQRNVAYLTVITRRDRIKYLDSAVACVGQEQFGPYVDHLADARTAFDSYSH
jgi:hypothetical protein